MLISAYVDNSLQIAKIFIVAHTKVCASVDLFVFLLLFCPRLYALLLFFAPFICFVAFFARKDSCRNGG